MTHAVVGSSIFADDDFLALPFEAKAAFLLLQPWAATAEGGRFGMVAAVKHLESMGAPSTAWQTLVDADMIRVDGKKWVLAGWDKHQQETPREPREGTPERPSTRAGREMARALKVLPEGWEKQFDAEEEMGIAARADTVSATWQGRAATWQHASDTPSPEVLPRPLPPRTPLSPTPTPTPTSPVSSPRARDGEFDPDQRDIRDTLYELTMVPPWGRDWGTDALKVEAEYGFAVLDEAIRKAFVELSYTRKPWQLVRHADAALSRARAIAKEREMAEARAYRAARPDAPTKPTRVVLDPAEFEEKAKAYDDAV